MFHYLDMGLLCEVVCGLMVYWRVYIYMDGPVHARMNGGEQKVGSGKLASKFV